MRRWAAMAVLMMATGAAAQAPVLAPADTAAPATVVVVPPPVVAVRTPAEIAAEKYRTEVVCKTSVDTGSLIARHKRCFTRKQWQYVNDENERLARRVVEDGTMRQRSN